jgi:hypothetical protein
LRHRIYIPLAGRPGTLRPSDAKAVGNGLFAVAGRAAKGEEWQFKPGELVSCESRTLPDGSKGLVAVAAVQADPETRSRRKVHGWFGGVIGGILGLWTALWLGFSGIPLLAIAASCAALLAWSAARWGDEAWEVLARLFGHDVGR